MPRKGAAGGKKKPLKNASKGRKLSANHFFTGLHLITNFSFSRCHTITGKELTPEEKAFKAKQAADKKAAAAYLKGKKSKETSCWRLLGFSFWFEHKLTLIHKHKKTLSYSFFSSTDEQPGLKYMRKSWLSRARLVLNPIAYACIHVYACAWMTPNYCPKSIEMLFVWKATDALCVE